MTLAAVCALVGFLAYRLDGLARARIAAQAAEASRRLALEERRLALEEKRVVATLEPEEVPADLRLRYEMETETWAREQMRALIRELFEQHKSWDAVRQQLGQLDMTVAHRELGWSQTRVTS